MKVGGAKGGKVEGVEGKGEGGKVEGVEGGKVEGVEGKVEDVKGEGGKVEGVEGKVEDVKGEGGKVEGSNNNGASTYVNPQFNVNINSPESI